MLTTYDLCYTYPSGATIHFPDIKITGPEALLILGQSGAGKTTLLHLLAGLMRPSSGSIDIDGDRIDEMSSRALDGYRGQNIGIIFQQNHFVAALTIIDNLVLAQRLAGTPTSKSDCQTYLDRLQIGSVADRYTDQLSQGQRQRVAIARALVNTPKIILADEPTSALDDQSCEEVIALLEDQSKASGAQLIIVTHDTRLKARYSQQVVLPALLSVADI